MHSYSSTTWLLLQTDTYTHTHTHTHWGSAISVSWMVPGKFLRNNAVSAFLQKWPEKGKTLAKYSVDYLAEIFGRNIIWSNTTALTCISCPFPIWRSFCKGPMIIVNIPSVSSKIVASSQRAIKHLYQINPVTRGGHRVCVDRTRIKSLFSHDVDLVRYTGGISPTW